MRKEVVKRKGGRGVDESTKNKYKTGEKKYLYAMVLNGSYWQKFTISNMPKRSTRGLKKGIERTSLVGFRNISIQNDLKKMV